MAPRLRTYETIAKKHKRIAEKWKAATGGDNTKLLSKALIVEMLEKDILRDGKLTPNEADALATVLDETRLEPDAQLYFAEWLEKNWGTPLVNQGARPLKDLTPVYAALSPKTVGKVNFRSEKTGLTYNPLLYQAMSKLIRAKEMTVYSLRAAFSGLDVRGYHLSDQNRLYLRDDLTPNEQAVIIVHEMTHAIQDYLDIPTHTIPYMECDAFIAGGVVDHILGAPLAGDALFDAGRRAAEQVIRGDGFPGKPGWSELYDEVLNAVLTVYPVTYKFHKKDKEDPSKPEFMRLIAVIRDMAIAEIKRH